jgi:hypothetical protein
MKKVGLFTPRLLNALLGAFVAVSFCPSAALAQDHDSHNMTSQQSFSTPESRARENALVEAVQRVTRRFRNGTPPSEGQYFLAFGCVSGGDFGAMGLHFINQQFAGNDEVKIDQPEILLYEPLPNGKIRLTGVDYLVDKKAWEANPAHHGPPSLNGQLFHLFDEPNRFGLPAFYTLHVWAWKDNPNGTFTNWNPNVSCDAYNDPQYQ